MRYVSATVKSYSAVKTKTALKKVVADINAGAASTDVDVTLNDPFGMGYGTMGVKDLLDAEVFEGVALQVSNEKRSWFASVQVSQKTGKLVVT